MNTKAGAHHDKGTSQAAADPASHDAPRKDHFLQLMFFQASHESGAAASRGTPPSPARAVEFSPLRNSKTGAGTRYALPIPGTTTPLRLDSPAVEVMTDLRKVTALTIGTGASIAEANRVMIARSVRALFVTDDARDLLGIVTATDTLGERPIQFAQARGVRYDEVTVRDIMTPADRLEVLDLRDLEGARVGDVVATLKFSGRQHALVAESLGSEGSGPQTICGIISLTQIGRRLGIPQQQIHDIARTFAEIEALIAAN
ncbi:MAG TPA: CBS domain-containing protein [Casimicrobiaceae bacterium]|nr:CBS domain-containing protein [Casimicrobiaceae bacterium]